MDVCIRAGFYEAAYSLTNYGLMLQQHGMTKNKVIKVNLLSLLDQLLEVTPRL